MALLNPPENQPNIAFLLYRYLVRQPDHTANWAEISRALAPPSVIDDLDAAARVTPTGNHHLPATARQCRDVGLFDINGSDVRLLPKVEPTEDRSAELAAFRRLLRGLVLDPVHNPEAWSTSKEENSPGATDLVRAISWYLMQSITKTPMQWKDTNNAPGASETKARQLLQTADNAVIRNDVRWGSFVRWSAYLGFTALQPIAAATGIMPNPTAAIGDTLSNLPHGSMPIRQFVDGLAERLPVLDRGRYWLQVEKRLQETHPRLGEDEISPALGHALLVLRDLGMIQLSDLADASDRMSFVEQKTPDNRFSHAQVKIGGRA